METFDTESIRRRNNNATFAKHLSIEVTELTRGLAAATMTITETMQNFLHLTHGGAIFAIADQACAAAANTYGRPAILTQMSVYYVHSPNAGDRLRAEAAVVERSRAGGVVEISVYDQDGRNVARCLGSFLFSKRTYEDFF